MMAELLVQPSVLPVDNRTDPLGDNGNGSLMQLDMAELVRSPLTTANNGAACAMHMLG